MLEAEPHVRTGEIQGNVLPGFNTNHQRLIGLRLEDVEKARTWLAGIGASVTSFETVRSERPPRRMRQPWLNLAFSHHGLWRLGAPGLERIEDSWFTNGMWSVAGSLGDGDISRWRHGNSEESTPDVLVILADNDEERLERTYGEVVSSARRQRVRECFVERGRRREDKTEHFGFRDGISLPVVRGVTPDGDYLFARSPDSTPSPERYSASGQILLWPGQAVFGYEGQRPLDRMAKGSRMCGGAPWMDDGSFLVFRRLRQHVHVFERFLEDAADRLSRVSGRVYTVEHVAALLVGRWRNGTSLVRYPDAPGEAGADANDFQFVARTHARPVVTDSGVMVQMPEAQPDLDGRLCPHFAHIRKVNPRDAPTDLPGEAMALMLQPFRRAIPWAYDDQHGEREQGLLFLAYCTAIRDRFGVLSCRWMNRDDAPEPGLPGGDPIAGSVQGSRHIEFRIDGKPIRVHAPEPWVETTGGGFFFSPSVSTLKAMSNDW